MAGIKRKSFRDDSSLGAADEAASAAAQGTNYGVNARRPSVSLPGYANSMTSHTPATTPSNTSNSTNNHRVRSSRSRSRGSKSGSISSRGGGHQSPPTASTSPINNGHRRASTSTSPAGNSIAIAEENGANGMSPPRAKRVRRTRGGEHDDATTSQRNGAGGKGPVSASTSPVSLRSTRQSAKLAATTATSEVNREPLYDGNGDDNAADVDTMTLDPPKAPSEHEQVSPRSELNGPTPSLPAHNNGHVILKLNFNKARHMNGNGNGNGDISGNGHTKTSNSENYTTSMAAEDTPKGDNTNENDNDNDGNNSSSGTDMKISPSVASVASAVDSQLADQSVEPSLSRLATPQPTAPRERGGTATPTSVTSRTGRGRGGFRGRARGGRRGGATRGNGVGRGRYPRNGRGRGGRLQSLDPEGSTSPIPAVRNLKERQRELEKVFRRIAQAQRAALAILASQTEESLIKDPEFHKKRVEWEIIQFEIDQRFERRIEQLENERDLCLEEENILFEGNKRRIEDWAKYNAGHLQRDLFLALQGDLTAKLEELFFGKQTSSEVREVQKDQEVEEVNEEEPAGTSEEPPDPELVKRTFVRGFNSNTVREPENAGLVDVAMDRWDWLSQLIKDPVHFNEIVETRLLEIKEEDEKRVQVEAEQEKAREDEAAAANRFHSLAQICSERLETYDKVQQEEDGKSADNLAALADVASNEKRDGEKSSEETLVAEGISSEEKIEEEVDEHGRRITRYSQRTRRSIDEGRRARLAEEPRPYQLPPPGHPAGHPPGPPLHPSHRPPPMYHHPHAPPPPPILPPPPSSRYGPGMQLAPLEFLEETKQLMPPTQVVFPPYHHGPPPPLPPLTIPENAPPPYRINNPHQRVLPQPVPGHPLYPVSAPLPPHPGPPPSGHYAPIPLPPSGPLYPGPPPPSGPMPPVLHPGEHPHHERRASLSGRRLLPAYTQGPPPQPQTAPAGVPAQPPSSVPPGPALPPPLHPHPNQPPPHHMPPEPYPPRHDPYYRLPPSGAPHHHHHHHSHGPPPPPPPSSYGPPYPGHHPLPPGGPHEPPPPPPPPPPGSHPHGHHPQHSPYTSPYGYDPGVFYRRNPYHMYPSQPYPPRHHEHHYPMQHPPPPPPPQQGQGQGPSPASHTPTSGHAPPPPSGSGGRRESGPRGERMTFSQRPPHSHRRRSSDGRPEEY